MAFSLSCKFQSYCKYPSAETVEVVEVCRSSGPCGNLTQKWKMCLQYFTVHVLHPIVMFDMKGGSGGCSWQFYVPSPWKTTLTTGWLLGFCFPGRLQMGSALVRSAMQRLGHWAHWVFKALLPTSQKGEFSRENQEVKMVNVHPLWLWFTMGWSDPEWLEIVDYLKLLWRIVQCFCRVSQPGHGKGCVGWVTIERVCCFHQGLLRWLIRQCRFMLHDQPTDIWW